MAILNVTPDSFSDGGLYFDFAAAVGRGQQMEDEGADIIDVGGESTRPGNLTVGEEEETRRVIPVIEALVQKVSIPVSIDTYRAAVARRALEAGAQIVNDISGLRYDSHLAATIQAAGCGCILMHSRGSREQIHQQPATGDPVETVVEGLQQSLEMAGAAGIGHGKIVLDPGIGFSKDAVASFRVLKSLDVFSRLGYPLLVGTSRKSFIRAFIQDSPEFRLLATAATGASAIAGGAHLLRVHDVRQMRVVADVTDRILVA